MKPIQKYIIIFVGFLIFLTLGYIGLQKSNTPISQSDIDIPTNQSIAPKPSPALSVSETVWGNNPFQTGDTHTGEVQKPAIPKIVFQKPNTEWKTRTLSGITYVFGEGNPKEVALNTNDLQEAYKRCNSKEDPENNSMLCRENSGYMSKEVEKHLLAALSDPNWPTLMILCEENLKVLYNQDNENALETRDYPSYNKILYGHFLDIEDWIYIRPDNGLKDLRNGKVMSLNQWLRWSTMSGWTHDTEWPTNSDGSKKVFRDPACVDKYGKEIIRNLTITLTYYNHPVEIFGEISPELLDSKQFKIY